MTTRMFAVLGVVLMSLGGAATIASDTKAPTTPAPVVTSPGATPQWWSRYGDRVLLAPTVSGSGRGVGSALANVRSARTLSRSEVN